MRVDSGKVLNKQKKVWPVCAASHSKYPVRTSRDQGDICQMVQDEYMARWANTILTRDVTVIQEVAQELQSMSEKSITDIRSAYEELEKLKTLDDGGNAVLMSEIEAYLREAGGEPYYSTGNSRMGGAGASRSQNY